MASVPQLLGLSVLIRAILPLLDPRQCLGTGVVLTTKGTPTVQCGAGGGAGRDAAQPLSIPGAPHSKE